MRPRLVKDYRLPLLDQPLHCIGAVEHTLEPVVHPMTATPFRLVHIRLDAGQALRDALAKGAPGAQGDRFPTARQLLADQAPHLRHEILVRESVVLEDEGDGPADRRPVGAAQGAEVSGGAAHGAHDAAHAVPRPPSLLLRPADVELHGDGALIVGIGKVPLDGQVEARDAVAEDLELAQAVGDVAPALLLGIQVQHVNGHVLLEPPRGMLQLECRPIVCIAGLQPVAQLWLLQRHVWRGRCRGYTTQTGDRRLRLGPSVPVFQVGQTAVLLHHDPTEVPVEVVPAVVGHAGLVREHLEAQVRRDGGKLPHARLVVVKLGDRGLSTADLWRHGSGDRGCPDGLGHQWRQRRQRRQRLDHRWSL
mmetsp:Transcript_114780/g.357504  ORF Transcript_114780/g.357504 Transcript_114780/m.357504 type:complete len:363 (-) Transcript_114780:894-1982(-)